MSALASAALGLLSRFALPLALGGLVVVGAYAAWTRVELALVRGEVESLTEKLGKCATDLAAERATIKRQAEAIADMKAKGEEAKAAVAEAEKKLRAQRAGYERRLREIAAAPVPQDCAGAVRWAAEEAAGIVREWEAAP